MQSRAVFSTICKPMSRPAVRGVVRAHGPRSFLTASTTACVCTAASGASFASTGAASYADVFRSLRTPSKASKCSSIPRPARAARP
jgi:hypothetical protein